MRAWDIREKEREKFIDKLYDEAHEVAATYHSRSEFFAVLSVVILECLVWQHQANHYRLEDSRRRPANFLEDVVLPAINGFSRSKAEEYYVLCEFLQKKVLDCAFWKIDGDYRNEWHHHSNTVFGVPTSGTEVPMAELPSVEEC